MTAQTVVSIGYHSSFTADRDVLVRKSMERKDGVALVQLFIKKMESLQRKHFYGLPQSIRRALKLFRIKITDKNLSVKEKSNIGAKLNYLEQLSNLKVLGFNSDSYDLPCLISYFLEVMGPENVHVIKRGSSLFALNYNRLSFRDAMNYSVRKFRFKAF